MFKGKQQKAFQTMTVKGQREEIAHLYWSVRQSSQQLWLRTVMRDQGSQATPKAVLFSQRECSCRPLRKSPKWEGSLASQNKTPSWLHSLDKSLVLWSFFFPLPLPELKLGWHQFLFPKWKALWEQTRFLSFLTTTQTTPSELAA